MDASGAWRGPAESSAECESAIVSPRQIEFNRTHCEQLLTSTQSPAAAAGCSCCRNSAGCCVLLVMSHTEQYFTLHIDNVYFCNRKIFLKTSRSRQFCFTSFIFFRFWSGEVAVYHTVPPCWLEKTSWQSRARQTWPSTARNNLRRLDISTDDVPKPDVDRVLCTVSWR